MIQSQYPKSDKTAFISTGFAFGRSLLLGRRVFMIRFAVIRSPRSMKPAALPQPINIKFASVSHYTPHTPREASAPVEQVIKHDRVDNCTERRACKEVR
jgi:predicted phosphohydrolase